MTREDYDKYKGMVSWFYRESTRVEVTCIYCADCKKYYPSSNFPKYGIINEFKYGRGLCTTCYTKKYALSQELLEKISDGRECVKCNQIKSIGYGTCDFGKYRNQDYMTCNECQEEIRKTLKRKQQAIHLLKTQGIETPDENTIKTKLLTLEIKNALRPKKLTDKEYALKHKK